MANLKPIRNEADYRSALARIDVLMEALPDTPEGEELDVLTDLVEHYEAKQLPLGFPSAKAAIEFRMEQAGLTERDLIPLLGSRAKVAEVMSGKRPLTMAMARALHERLGVPADVLIKGFDEPRRLSASSRTRSPRRTNPANAAPKARRSR